MIQEDYYLQAAQRGDFTTVEAMVRQKEVDVDAVDELDTTALMRAAERDDRRMVDYLIEMGADVKKKSAITGETALLTATENNHRVVIETLLENGADVNEADNHGKTPLLSAVQKQNKALTVRFVKEGADLNKENVWGQTPLMRAVLNNDKETVKLFVEKGADVNKQDEKGQTALHLAVLNNDKETAVLLIDNGADFEMKNNAGKTAVDVSFEQKNPEMFELLVRLGAKTTAKTAESSLSAQVNQALLKTPEFQMHSVLSEKEAIHPMVQKAFEEAVLSDDVIRMDSSVRTGFVDLNKQDENGQTALMKAAELGNRDVFVLLLSYGADVKKTDQKGQTVVDVLVQKSQKEGLNGDLTEMMRMLSLKSQIHVQRAHLVYNQLQEKQKTRV